MDIKLVKNLLGKTVYYDTGQINFDGCTIKDFIFTACILRKKKNGQLYYQAELMDTVSKNSVIIVCIKLLIRCSFSRVHAIDSITANFVRVLPAGAPREKVLTKSEV